MRLVGPNPTEGSAWNLLSHYVFLSPFLSAQFNFNVIRNTLSLLALVIRLGQLVLNNLLVFVEVCRAVRITTVYPRINCYWVLGHKAFGNNSLHQHHLQHLRQRQKFALAKKDTSITRKACVFESWLIRFDLKFDLKRIDLSSCPSCAGRQNIKRRRIQNTPSDAKIHWWFH